MMSPLQAQAEILRLAGEGKTHQEIADSLKEKGYLHKTGRPITMKTVCNILLRAGHRRHSKKGARKPTAAASKLKAVEKKPTAAASKLKAVERILSLSSMPADERIALAQLLIGG